MSHSRGMNRPLAGDHLVPRARNDDRPALVERPQPGLDDGLRVGEPAVDRRVADIGAKRIDETRAGGTGTQCGDRHAGRTRLGPQGLLNERTNALLAPYTAWYGAGWNAIVDATLRIPPLRRASMPGRNARARVMTALTSTATSSDSRPSASANGP